MADEMADQKAFSWKQFIVEGVMLGVGLAVFGFYLNERLEKYKGGLQAMSPVIDARRDAYLSVLQGARRLTRFLEGYYDRAQGPPTNEQIIAAKLGELERAMHLESGGSGGDFYLKSDAFTAVTEFLAVRNKYADTCSEDVRRAVDTFTVEVIDGLKVSTQEGETVQSDTAARSNLNAAFGKLNKAINDALGTKALPIK